ncbi:unnamed protein product (macronuclear) [Paramecium tetraurelia]|uniref:Tubulin beta chain n=1 Tax=Paramecium tetraurelia TaxID=5888 RepID=Q3SD83_PARTE|nr:uncharacterized protein GSPATT00012209001 [Paramecium tetraurelia]CAI44482.1 beta tubulin,putative [Paramecium tetraurelia]CAK76657.1 unnamed protein product [Paramecium tetraurelia]|eukprot:XP_001444054.1 hypothetical protein (macronuclear) [Paramecium tetraurelia strain d4-2]
MGEIIQLSFGDIANNIGHQYLEKLIDDHCLDDKNNSTKDQYRQKIHVSFEELKTQQYQFRGIFVNSSDQSIHKLLISPESEYINNDLILENGNRNKSGTFSNSQLNFRDQIKDKLFEKLRHQIEKCDKFFGCQFAHSTYDYSSGSSSVAIDSYKEGYPYSPFCSSFSILPNIVSSNTIEIYNTCFSMHKLIEYCDVVMLFDYGALENQLTKLRQLSTLENCNNVIAECLLQMNCSQRFPGYQNGDQKKLSTNLIPFPRLHFLTCAFTPIEIVSDLNQKLINLCLPTNSYFSFQNATRNLYLSQAFITRCNSYYLDFQYALSKLQNNIEWIPDAVFHINCKIENRNLGKTAMHVGNHRDLGHSFKQHCEIFTANFRRKAFIHYYLQDGMDEMEFTEAESNMNDFISEYQDYCYGCEISEYEEEEQQSEYDF